MEFNYFKMFNTKSIMGVFNTRTPLFGTSWNYYFFIRRDGIICLEYRNKREKKFFEGSKIPEEFKFKILNTIFHYADLLKIDLKFNEDFMDTDFYLKYSLKGNK